MESVIDAWGGQVSLNKWLKQNVEATAWYVFNNHYTAYPLLYTSNMQLFALTALHVGVLILCVIHINYLCRYSTW